MTRCRYCYRDFPSHRFRCPYCGRR
jgi:hypothetical protein